MRNVYIIPFEGICNRMRAIASGVMVAKKIGSPAVIFWNKEKRCNCWFGDLFEPVVEDGVTVVENRSLINAIPKRGNLKLPLLLQKIKYSQVVYLFNENTDGDIMSVIKSDADDILLESSASMGDHYPVNNLFTPLKQLREKVDAISTTFDRPNVIGIHIRGTDNKISKRFSTLDKFIARIDNEIGTNAAARFFVATDEIAARHELIRRYGKRIIYCDDLPDRNSVEGLRGAIVELYCLSKTSHVIGSCGSTFSGTAAEIGGIPLEECR